MGLRSFEYIEPQSIAEACAALSQRPEDARVYAGGTSLLLLMKQGIVRPTHLVNIKKLSDLRFIKDDGATIRIGALTTHHDLEISPIIRECFPFISDAEQEIANIRVRSTGTVGGNLAFAEPLTDLPPMFIALDGRVQIAGPNGSRTIPLENLFVGYYETALQTNELISEVQLDKTGAHFGMAYLRFSAGSDKPTVGCAVAIKLDPHRPLCADSRIVLGCVAPTPLRVREAEDILRGQEFRSELVEAAAQIAMQACSPLSDIRGSEEYKRAIVEVLAKRAVAEAFQHAQASSSNGTRAR